MLKRSVLCALFLFFSGSVLYVHSQESEGVIFLSSPEEVEQFKHMLEEKTEPLQEKKEEAKPRQADKKQQNAVSEKKEPPKKIEAAESGFEVYKPRAKDEYEKKAIKSEEKVSKPPEDAGKDAEFKVYVPVPAEPEEENASGGQASGSQNVIWLDSPEDIEKFNEMLQKNEMPSETK